MSQNKLRKKTTRVLAALGVVLMLATVLAAAGGSASAGGNSQFQLFKQTTVHKTDAYAIAGIKSGSSPDRSRFPNSPGNWTTNGYDAGNLYMKIKWTKPSNERLKVQLCSWRHSSSKNFNEETCAKGVFISGKSGTAYYDFGAPKDWWKKNGSFKWNTDPSLMRVMVKDPANQRLMLTQKCGNHCSSTSRVKGHIPITFEIEAIVVKKGASLSRPAGWPSNFINARPSSSSGGTVGGTTPATTPATTPTTQKTTTTSGTGGDPAPTPTGDYPTNIKDPILAAERNAAASAACKAASAATVGTKAEKKAACSEAALAAWKAKKAEQLAIIKGGGGSTPTTTPTTGGSYPTSIKDPILAAERNAAASAACHVASNATVGTKAEKKAACSDAALTAWKAKKAEQLAIING